MKAMNRVLALGLTFSTFCASPLALADGPGNTTELFRANELSIDLFGSGSIGQQTIDNISGDRVRDDIRLGAGAGINYFFTRNFGLGLDGYSEDTSGEFVDSAALNLIFRLPIGESGFAPYIFGGATRQFDRVRQWAGDAGGGFEFRFDQHWALFVDARYVIADKTDNYGVGRGGLRISF
jgi:hypothetical protein